MPCTLNVFGSGGEGQPPEAARLRICAALPVYHVRSVPALVSMSLRPAPLLNPLAMSQRVPGI
jgi:hypothetical protein